MPAQLIALHDGPNILLDKPILLLGRHPECDIQIDSRKISRRHCCIAQVENYLVVRNLGSTNGIRINGTRVVEGKLHPSDELTIGNSRYKISWDSVVMEKEPANLHAREAASAASVASVDDEMLEECDDPVPLEEADQEPSVMAGTAPKTALDLDSEPLPEDPQAMILPENLELAPASDIKDPKHSSGS